MTLHEAITTGFTGKAADATRPPVLHPNELAQAMLDWATKRRELDELEHQIRSTIIHIAKTQTVGNVRCSYFAGRKAYDYEGAAKARDPAPALIDTHTKVIYKTDWRTICEDLKIDKGSIPFVTSGCLLFYLVLPPTPVELVPLAAEMRDNNDGLRTCLKRVADIINRLEL